MASPIPSPSALRLLRQLTTTQSALPIQSTGASSTGQIRHATLLRRPKRPYTFTQLVTLSDGSTFVQRTTNPQPIYKSTKDTRNTALWNPSSQKLLNVEEDEAGKLRAFRAKFGRGWDAADGPPAAGEENADKDSEPTDHLLDLISGSKSKKELKAEIAARAAEGTSKAAAAAKAAADAAEARKAATKAGKKGL